MTVSLWKRRGEIEGDGARHFGDYGGALAPSVGALTTVEPSVRNSGDPETHQTALGRGSRIEGVVRFTVAARIDGQVVGELSSPDLIIIGDAGSVEGAIEAAWVIIYGRVHGTIRAHQRVELRRGAQCEGRILTPSFTMEEGSLYEGQLAMREWFIDDRAELEGFDDDAQSLARRVRECGVGYMELDPCDA